MIFEKGHLYHIYNQGNNKQNIFYNRENYLFFLKKVNKYILLYANVFAWCLMPNHFHLMVLVNKVELFQGFTLSEALNKNKPNLSGSATRSSTPTDQTLNASIGIMLASINKQQNATGSIFRSKTKAECINCFKGVKPSFIQSNVLINNHLPKKQYPQVCFDYIHQNPVKASLVKTSTDWEFSSAKDYTSLRNGKLVNKAVAEEYVDS